MSLFYRVEERRAGLRPVRDIEDRLPLGQSVAVIAGLSVLSWAVLIGIVIAFRAVL